MSVETEKRETGSDDQGSGRPGGLPRGERAAEREPRDVPELIEAAAADSGLTAGESEDLLAYYLQNGELPGDSDTLDVEVELGHGGHKRKLTCTVKPITWAEWQDAQDRAASDDGTKFDTYVAASWNVARALVRPQLGPLVLRQRQQAKDSEDGLVDGPDGRRLKPVDDGAQLLRRMFLKQSGALLDLSAKVVEISKLRGDQQAVSEIEAAKN